jgi:chromosome segregation ATPase
MSSLAFDTLKYANRLKDAGVPPAQAEAQVEVLAEALQSQDKAIAENERAISGNDKAAARIESRLERFEARVDRQFAEARAELQKETAPIKADIVLLKWMMGVIVAGVIALIAKAFLHI